MALSAGDKWDPPKIYGMWLLQDDYRAAHSLKHFQAPIQESISNTFSHLHITRNPASTEQSLPHTHMRFMGHSLDCILCLLQIASMAKKVTHACVMPQFCRNRVNYDHWSITVHSASHHPPNLHSCKLTEDKQKSYHLAVHLHTSVQNV
jgi:hypothetical protein